MTKSSKYLATVIKWCLISENGSFKALINFLGLSVYILCKAVNMYRMPV